MVARGLNFAFLQSVIQNLWAGFAFGQCQPRRSRFTHASSRVSPFQGQNAAHVPSLVPEGFCSHHEQRLLSTTQTSARTHVANFHRFVCACARVDVHLGFGCFHEHSSLRLVGLSERPMGVSAHRTIESLRLAMAHQIEHCAHRHSKYCLWTAASARIVGGRSVAGVATLPDSLREAPTVEFAVGVCE